MLSIPFLSLSLSLLSHLTTTLAQQCYYPDGSFAENDTPCNTTASATNCCQNGAACLSSGLCYLIFDMSINTGSCTDKSWKTEECFQKCPNADNQAAPNTLYRCHNNKWCCSAGGNTTSCCNDPGIDLFGSTLSTIYNGSAFSPNYTVVPVSEVVRASASGGSSGTASATAGSESGSSCPSTSSSAFAQREDVRDAEVRVGLGVGLGIGVPLLAALVGMGVLLGKERRGSRELRRRVGGATGAGAGVGVDGGEIGKEEGRRDVRHEIGGGERMEEMEGTVGRRELAGEGRGGW